MAAYDSIGLSVLSPVTSPRRATRENEYYYTLVFPNTRASADGASCRISYRDAVLVLRSVTSGGNEREKLAVDEFKRAWMAKFRATPPQPQDTIQFRFFQELLREVMIQRFDAITGLFFQTSVSEDGTLLRFRFRPSSALLATMAHKAQLRVPMMAEIDPGEAYWASDPTRSQRERVQWSKADAQEELYRMFLAGKIPMDDAQLFENDKEDTAMWSRRIHALKRIADSEVMALVQQQQQDKHHPPLPMYLPYTNRASLQYLYRQIDSSALSDSCGNEGSSPFRVVDKIRLTKAIIDAEFDCEALVEQGVLVQHMCTHTHHTDTVDTSIDVLRFQWGSLLSPVRVYLQGLTDLAHLLSFQPILHVRNYFGEELALYFAYTSFYAQSLQYLCGAALFLYVARQYWSSSAADDEAAKAASAYVAIGFSFVNCAFLSVFVRKWELRERQYASEWGVTDLKHILHARPQFRGQLERSPINLRLEPHYPPHKRVMKRAVSFVLLLALSAALIGGYLLLLSSTFLRRSSSVGALWGSNLLLAVLTKCVGLPLAHISKRLNDWENYKTQIDYDANLTLKYALLQTANSFGMLWYMTFLRPFLSNDARLVRRRYRRGSTNSPHLKANENSSRRSLLPKNKIHDGVREAVDNEDEAELLEEELALDAYEGVMFDYAQVIVNFGFVTWFAALQPASCVLALIVAVLQIRIDTFKLCYLVQRPFPAQKNSIGSWLIYLRFLSLGSLLHNAAIACMIWMENLSPKPMHALHLHDLLLLKGSGGTNADLEALLLVGETEALVIFSVFGFVWFFMGLYSQADRARLKLLFWTQQKQRFLEDKYLRSIDRVADNVKELLPLGRVFLNGVHRYIATGNKAEEDAAEEIFEELRRHQLRSLEMEKRITELRDVNAEFGSLYVEVVSINILPVMDALTKAVDSFVQLKLKAGKAETDNSGGTANSEPLPRPRLKGTKSSNTSVIKKNRSPRWHEKFDFSLKTLDDTLALSIFDWELLGKNRCIGNTKLAVAEVISQTCSRDSESPIHHRLQQTTADRKHSTATRGPSGDGKPTSPAAPVMASFELPIEMPEVLLNTMHSDLLRHGHPRLSLRCGVQLHELGLLQFQQRRFQQKIETLKEAEKQFFQWK
uniref:C2 domain-containing protein n=1 Tax=Globisporangium ultimum (strain ATCC 200006 / CBS 805.95 / DAOM BR144) TaxID=431595 RepID=K3XC92_GLOUD